MAKSKRELLITLGADTTTFSQKVKRAKDLTKELDSNFKLLSSSSKNFDDTIDGVQQKQIYLNNRIKVANTLTQVYNDRLKEQQECLNNSTKQLAKLEQKTKDAQNAIKRFEQDLQKANGELQNSNIDLQKVTQQIQDLEDEVTLMESYRDAVSSTSQEWMDWQREIDRTAKEISNFRQQAQTISDDIEKTTQRIDIINQNIEDTKNALKDTDQQIERTKKEMRTFRDSIISVNTAFDKNQTEIQRMNAELTQTNLRLGMLKRDKSLKSLSDDITEADRKFKNAKNSVSTFGNNISHLTLEEEHLNKQINRTSNLMGEYARDIEDSENEMTKMRISSKKLLGEVRNLEKVVNNMDGTEDNYRNLSNNLNALRAELTNTNRIYEIHKERVESISKSYKESENDLKQMEGDLKRVKIQLKEVGNKNEFKSLEKEIENSRHSFEMLESQLELLRSKFVSFETSLKGAKEESKLLKQENVELRKEYQQQQNLITAYKNKLSTLEDEYDKLEQKIDSTKKSMQNMQKGSNDWQQAILKLGELENSFEQVDQEIEQVTNSLKEAQFQSNSTLTKINNNIQGQGRQWSVLSEKIKGIGGNLTSIGGGIQSIGGALTPATAGVTALGAGVVTVGANFEESMSKVQAFSGASNEELKEMTDTARQLGKDTIFSATEASEGLQMLSLAGLSARDSMDSLPIILQSCMAGAMEMSTASDLATDVLGSLGDNSQFTENKVENLRTLMNQLAVTSTGSTTSIEGLLESFVKVGGQVEQMNIPLSTANTLLAILGDRGIKAEEAGNSLNSILINLTKKSGESAEALEELGVSAFDSNGNIKPIEQTLGELKGKLSGLSEEKRIQLINMIGGKTQAKTLQKLLQGIDADTKTFTGDYAELKKEIEESVDTGALEQMAEDMTDNLSSDFKIMKSALQEMFLTIFDDLSPKLRELVQSVTDVINELTNNDTIKNIFSDIIDVVQDLVDKFKGLSPSMQENIIKFTIFAGVFAPIISVIGTLVSSIGSITSAFGGVIGIFGKVTTKLGLLSEGGAGLASIFSGGLSGALGTLTSTVLPALGLAFTAVGIIIGDNEKILDLLMDKFGVFGSFLSGFAEFVNGIFTALQGQIGTFVKGIVKTVGAILKGDLSSIDDIWSKTWSQMQNNSAKAWDNITLNTTTSISYLKQCTSEDVKEIQTIFEDSFEQLKNASTSDTKEMAKNFSKMFADSDGERLKFAQQTIDIVSGTSDTMRILFSNIKGNMDISDAERQFEKNLYNLVNSGDYTADEIAKDFENAWSIIDSNIIDGGESIKKNAGNVLDDFGTIASGRIDAGAESVAESLSSLGMKGVESLRGIGKNWNTIFQGISEDGATTTEEMKEAILNNLDKLGLDTPEKIQEFKETLQEELDATSQTTKEKGKEIGLNLGEGFSEGAETTKENSYETGKEIGEETVEGTVNSLSQLPTSIKEQLAQAGVTIDEQGNVIVADMAEKGKEGAEAYVNEMNDNLPKLSSVANTIQDQLSSIDGVRFGGVTKQLSEINKWLNTVTSTAGKTKTGLVNVKSVTFGTTTKGLSEVKKWLENDEKCAKKLELGLKNVKAVTFGTTTKGLSEVKKWLDRVNTSGKNARASLVGITNVRFGGVTKQLSNIVSWLDKVKNRASNTRSAISNISTARAKVVSASAVVSEQLANIPNVTSLDNYSTSIMSDSVDLSNYKTSGGFYAVQDITGSTPSNSENNQKTLIDTLLKQNELLVQLLTRDNSINVTLDADGRQLARVSAKYVNEEIQKITTRKQRLIGGTI